MRPSSPHRRTLRDLDTPDPRGAEPFSIQAQPRACPSMKASCSSTRSADDRRVGCRTQRARRRRDPRGMVTCMVLAGISYALASAFAQVLGPRRPD
jgi:hypothetical protein